MEQLLDGTTLLLLLGLVLFIVLLRIVVKLACLGLTIVLVVGLIAILGRMLA
jgi:hypothetical protein